MQDVVNREQFHAHLIYTDSRAWGQRVSYPVQTVKLQNPDIGQLDK